MIDKIVIKDQIPSNKIIIKESITKIYPPLEDLVVRARAEEQIFEHENSYGYDKVTVEPIEIKLQDKEVLPSYDTQKIIADNDYDGLREVTVNPIVLNLQNKEVTPSYEVQEVTADNGYDALKKVTVKAKTGYDTDDADAVASDIIAGKIAYGKDGKIIGSMTSSNNALINTKSYKHKGSYANFVMQYVTKAEIDLSGFTDCRYAFSGCQNLESLTLTGTEDGAILYADYMFQDCTELKEVPSFNSSNVVTLTSCFSNCKSLKKITEFNTGKATVMREMFNECIALEEICELDCKNNKSVQGMFYNNSSLKILGGLKELGKAYTGSSVNSTSYNLNLTMSSNLTKQSLLNVINGLYDLASHNKPAQGLFLGEINLAKLTAEEIAIATNKGWNVS